MSICLPHFSTHGSTMVALLLSMSVIGSLVHPVAPAMECTSSRETLQNQAYVTWCKQECHKVKDPLTDCPSFCLCRDSEVNSSCNVPEVFTQQQGGAGGGVPPLSVTETAAPDTTIFRIPVSGEETWSLTLDPSPEVGVSRREALANYFRLLRVEGEYVMLVAQTPDLEAIMAKHHFQLTDVTLQLTCSRPESADQTYQTKLAVKPVNEFAPTFLTNLETPDTPFYRNVRENSEVGSVVLQLSDYTIDPDVNPSTKEIASYRIWSYIPDPRHDGKSYFSMTSSPTSQSGSIYLSKPLDFEQLQATDSLRMFLNVSASDVAGNTTFTKVMIEVKDDDDLPPEFYDPRCRDVRPKVKPCLVSYTAEVPLHYTGEVVSIQPSHIQARDLDTLNSEIVYSLEAAPGQDVEQRSRFSINSTTGRLYVVRPFVSEATISLVVVATENSSLSHLTQSPLQVSVLSSSVTPSLTTFTTRMSTNDDVTSDVTQNNDNNRSSSYQVADTGGSSPKRPPIEVNDNVAITSDAAHNVTDDGLNIGRVVGAGGSSPDRPSQVNNEYKGEDGSFDMRNVGLVFLSLVIVALAAGLIIVLVKWQGKGGRGRVHPAEESCSDCEEIGEETRETPSASQIMSTDVDTGAHFTATGIWSPQKRSSVWDKMTSHQAPSPPSDRSSNHSVMGNEHLCATSQSFTGSESLSPDYRNHADDGDLGPPMSDAQSREIARQLAMYARTSGIHEPMDTNNWGHNNAETDNRYRMQNTEEGAHGNDNLTTSMPKREKSPGRYESGLGNDENIESQTNKPDGQVNISKSNSRVPMSKSSQESLPLPGKAISEGKKAKKLTRRKSALSQSPDGDKHTNHKSAAIPENTIVDPVTNNAGSPRSDPQNVSDPLHLPARPRAGSYPEVLLIARPKTARPRPRTSDTERLRLTERERPRTSGLERLHSSEHERRWNSGHERLQSIEHERRRNSVQEKMQTSEHERPMTNGHERQQYIEREILRNNDHEAQRYNNYHVTPRHRNFRRPRTGDHENVHRREILQSPTRPATAKPLLQELRPPRRKPVHLDEWHREPYMTPDNYFIQHETDCIDHIDDSGYEPIIKEVRYVLRQKSTSPQRWENSDRERHESQSPSRNIASGGSGRSRYNSGGRSQEDGMYQKDDMADSFSPSQHRELDTQQHRSTR